MTGVCFSNYTILPIYWPEKPSQPCLTCTKQWCLDQQLPICSGAVLEPTDPDTATGKEGDVEARCFERDSPRDELVVTIFLIIVFGLLVGAAVKGRMDRANLTVNWDVGTRRWWEAWLPGGQRDNPYDLGSNRDGHRRARSGGYVDLQTEETEGH
ncbi:hypothetical protein FRC19_009908 [Serendipita sp. 401]|nr:hypothetical protein FRC16_003637 [Serendipita sp. 398]KAG8828052.1 hypothetical protein FRC19_009908 [Serendipita sp. 401]KAG8875446.1 hypothetical protein FRC20_003860 [Serendipita sp. 405]KAG9058358.1 hypothetical protein FS842_010084 [Serendipita sp. 407]